MCNLLKFDLLNHLNALKKWYSGTLQISELHAGVMPARSILNLPYTVMQVKLEHFSLFLIYRYKSEKQ